jgi:hypothetical protein
VFERMSLNYLRREQLLSFCGCDWYDGHKRRVIWSVFQMEVAVVDYDSDTTVEIGNTWIHVTCSYKLGYVFVNYLVSAKKKIRLYIICESNSIADICNNYGVVSTRNVFTDIWSITNTMKGPNVKVDFDRVFVVPLTSGSCSFSCTQYASVKL